MSRGDGARYLALMAKAATGDEKAARALLDGEWFVGDSDDPHRVAQVIAAARAASSR